MVIKLDYVNVVSEGGSWYDQQKHIFASSKAFKQPYLSIYDQFTSTQ